MDGITPSLHSWLLMGMHALYHITNFAHVCQSFLCIPVHNGFTNFGSKLWIWL